MTSNTRIQYFVRTCILVNVPHHWLSSLCWSSFWPFWMQIYFLCLLSRLWAHFSFLCLTVSACTFLYGGIFKWYWWLMSCSRLCFVQLLLHCKCTLPWVSSERSPWLQDGCVRGKIFSCCCHISSRLPTIRSGAKLVFITFLVFAANANVPARN